MGSQLSRLIGGLTVGRKLALIYFLDLITVIFISGILINEKYIAINFSRKELVGSAYIATVRDGLLAIVERDAGTPVPIMPLAGAVAAAERQFGAEMGTAVLSERFARALAAPSASVTHDVALGRELLTRIGNQSNLILDPDLDSYYTMSLVVLRFPELLDVIDRLRSQAREMGRLAPSARQIPRTQFLILEGRIDAILTGIDSDYSEAFSASSPELKSRLEKGHQNLVIAMQRFRNYAQALAGISETTAAADVAAPPMAIDSLRLAWSQAQAEMQRLLQVRIDEAFQRMWLHLGTALLLMSIILTLVLFVARQIAIPIGKLAVVADRVRRSGDYTLRADWLSSDEIGRLVAGFNGMLQQLDHHRIAQQEMAAQAGAADAQRALIEAIPIPLMVTAIPDHQILHANAAARRWLGAHDRDPWHSGMPSALRARFFQSLHDTGAVDEFEVHWTAGASPSWALVSARCLDYQGQAAVLTTFTPMNRLKQMESGLELWGKVFEASSESIVVMDQRGRIVTVNRAFRRGSAFEIHELMGQSSEILLAASNPPGLLDTVRNTTATKGAWQGEVWLNRKNGAAFPAWLVMNAVRNADAEITHFITMSLDISERKASEQRIHYLAHHDVLTGLPNRFSCDERLKLSIQLAQRQHVKAAVLFVDLDRFKNINDSLGHQVGDELLCSVGSRLLGAVREGDTVSRLGGDEFVVILNNVTEVEEIGKLIEHRLLPAIRQPHQIHAEVLYISCSIGVAVFPDDSDDAEGLMRHADAAMYQAKRSGRNNAHFFTPELNARVTRHLHLESDLRHAVARHQLELHYQPRIDALSRRIAGVESLVRWHHPSQGMIPPGQFIPLAEESGLIIEIGTWIVDEACRQHQQWRLQGIGPIPVSINLSALQLIDSSLEATLAQAIARFDVPAAQIELELTETLLMEKIDITIAVLDRIKKLGFTLSIDDFGTGYSSLNYLCRFPIDKLKIDRSFIQNMHSAPENLAVTKAIVGLGHTLGLEVVAEGVEHASDVQVLQSIGCDELQGFFYGQPMPAVQFVAWLEKHRATTG